MTQKSAFWAGITTGDAGPYTDLVFTDWFKRLFISDATKQGIIAGYGNELALSLDSDTLHVASGYAIVDGKFYSNDDVVDFTLTPGTGTYYNYYRVVLRRDTAAQTVRLAILGPNGATYPSVTQDASIWEIAIGKVKISTSGVPVSLVTPEPNYIARLSTRKMLITPSAGYNQTDVAVINRYAGVIAMPYNKISYAGEYFVVPSDYLANLRISAVVINPFTTGDVFINNTGGGYLQIEVLSTIAIQYLYERNIVNGTYSPGSVVQVTFYRDGTSGDDNLHETLGFIGWLVEYDSIG